MMTMTMMIMMNTLTDIWCNGYGSMIAAARHPMTTHRIEFVKVLNSYYGILLLLLLNVSMCMR